MTIRRKSAYNLDAQQVALVLQAMKAQRKRSVEAGHNAEMSGNQKAIHEYAEMIKRYDNLIQYFEDKGRP